MKKMFKIKALYLVLFAVLLFSLVTVGAYAEEGEAYSWDMTTDEGTVWNEDREYYRYDVPFGYTVDFNPNYYFADEIEYSVLFSYNIMSYARDGEIIAIYDVDIYDYYYYATEEGKASIDALVGGNYTTARIYDDGYAAVIDKTVVDSLDKLNTGVEVDVSELADLNCYQIRIYDSTDSVYYVYGSLYEYQGKMYYLNYDRLSNEYFDADGEFSYRRGSVTIYPVDDAGAYSAILDAEDNMSWFEKDREYEDDSAVLGDLGFDVDGEIVSLIIFWFIFVAIGIILPVWPLIKGIKNSRSDKHARKRYWLFASLASLVIIVIDVVIMLLLIFG